MTGNDGRSAALLHADSGLSGADFGLVAMTGDDITGRLNVFYRVDRLSRRAYRTYLHDDRLKTRCQDMRPQESRKGIRYG